jgi:hypothetical protein
MTSLVAGFTLCPPPFACNKQAREKGSCRQPRVCPLCSKTFSNAFNLKQHMMNIHIPPVATRCPECQCIVKNKLYLRKHLVKAHKVPLRRIRDSNGRRIYVQT